MDNTDQVNQPTPTSQTTTTVSETQNQPVQVAVTPTVTTVETANITTDITPQETTVNPTPGSETTIITQSNNATQVPTQTVITPPTSITIENKPAEIKPGFVPPPSIEAPVSTPMGVSGTPVTNIPVVSTPIQTTTTETVTTTTEPSLPTKKNASPVLLTTLFIAFLVIAGGGTFLISRAISSQQAVAPTAPTSNPFAFEGSISATPSNTIPQPPSGPAYDDGSIDCSDRPGYEAYQGQCYPTAADEQGFVYWITTTGN